MISKEKTLLFMKLVEDDLKVADEQQGAEASLLSWLSSGITDEELTDLLFLIQRSLDTHPSNHCNFFC